MVELDKIGNAISYLRKRAGFTQKDIADRLGISDKAVSKWERGLGLPDVSLLSKLSILLDTDIDSLLNGDVIHHDEQWNGVLIFEEDEIPANTMIYDKPLCSYLLSYFLLVGIKRINIQASKKDIEYLKNEYSDGSKLGVELVFSLINEKIKFSNGCTNVMVVYGKSFIFGVDQTRFFKRAMVDKNNTVVLSLPKESESEEVKFDENKKVTEEGRSLNTQYNYYQVPVVFMPKKSFNSWALSHYKIKKGYYTELLDRGFVEIPIKTADDVIDASQFVRTVQKHCEMHIYCLEEIAWRRGMITIEKLQELALEKETTDYGQYLLKLYERNKLS